MSENTHFDFDTRPVIKGYPELRWTGKRPYTSTEYYPAQLRESYGHPSDDGWMNKIYWGDNLQVMSHLLKEYRGQVDLIYIDPPFDSKADYKKKINLKGIGKTESDQNCFEEKQYGDIWTSDEYLQFMYERLILMRELLSPNGSIYVHLDWHRVSQIRLVMDEVFGPENFQREIIWTLSGISGYKSLVNSWVRGHDTILYYSKGPDAIFNKQYLPYNESQLKRFSSIDENGRRYKSITKERRMYLDESKGVPISDVWTDIASFQTVVNSPEITNYPTQKPEKLIQRIIEASSNPGDIVFDCFMGSGTTQSVSMKLGRRFIGADINLGAIQTTTKRLINVAKELDTNKQPGDSEKYTGFEVYNVNNYDFFRNPVEAKDLLIDALGIQSFGNDNIWDGELDGRMVKIMPVNRIATKADLENLKAELPYADYEKRLAENPGQPAERITIVCMGHEPDLQASLTEDLKKWHVDVKVVDILKDKSDLQFKRDSEADIAIEGKKLVIRNFYPMNLMQKLSLEKDNYVEDWRQLVESVMIDWNYDGAVLQPTTIDIPDKKDLVKGTYDIPENSGTIRVKITDLLSESLEMDVK